MLSIKIPETEVYDEKTRSFVRIREQEVQLEHSLISISKWESKFHKPFLVEEPKTLEETLAYLDCMLINKVQDLYWQAALSDDDLRKVYAYIEDPMTATKFYGQNGKETRKETVTSELIYYWMMEAGVPFECQKWHLNRLLTLIRVCGVKRSDKKMSASETSAYNRALNASRRKRLGSRG